jgi:hypothetical protein
VFFVRDRYRVPLTAALIPFAALTVVQVVQWLRDGRQAKSVLAITAIALLAAWTARPLPNDIPVIRPDDYTTSYQVYYNPLEVNARQEGNYLKAADLLLESLAFEPEMVKRLGPAHPTHSPLEAELALFFSDIHGRCAEDYRLAGRLREALRESARAKELNDACPEWP